MPRELSNLPSNHRNSLWNQQRVGSRDSLPKCKLWNDSCLLKLTWGWHQTPVIYLKVCPSSSCKWAWTLASSTFKSLRIVECIPHHGLVFWKQLTSSRWKARSSVTTYSQSWMRHAVIRHKKNTRSCVWKRDKTELSFPLRTIFWSKKLHIWKVFVHLETPPLLL